jgi:hypothetical protein
MNKNKNVYLELSDKTVILYKLCCTPYMSVFLSLKNMV